MLSVHTLTNGALEENAYLLRWEGQEEAILIDPGDDAAEMEAAIRGLKARPSLILATHGHYDHVGGVAHLKQAFGARFAMHRLDAPLLQALVGRASALSRAAARAPEVDEWIKGGDQVAVGAIRLAVLATPGHTPGGLCFWHEASKSVFCGDTLFDGSVGRSDLGGGSHEQLINSIRNALLTLPDDTRAYPGHGPDTAIGREKRTNPFLQ